MRHHHDRNQSVVARATTARRRLAIGLTIAGIALAPTLVGGVARTPSASAALASVNLGTAGSFAVLAGSGVTNTGPTVLEGNLGTCPTHAIIGFPPGVVNGETHPADSVACQAQSDLAIAYDSAAGRAPTTSHPGATELGSSTLTTGVYMTPLSFAVTGTLTLDAEGDPDAVFIFQAGSTLITAVNSKVALINGAQACNVFWQVGSSATLGVGSSIVGTVLALTSITANTNAGVEGRLLARNGAVTLDSNKVTVSTCATDESTSSSEAGSSSSSTTLPASSSSSSSTTLLASSSSTSSTSSTSNAPPITTPSTGNEEAAVASTTSSTRLKTEVLSEVLSADPTEPAGPEPVPVPVGALPRTGSPIGTTVLVASLTLVAGATALRLSRAPTTWRRRS